MVIEVMICLNHSRWLVFGLRPRFSTGLLSLIIARLVLVFL